MLATRFLEEEGTNAGFGDVDNGSAFLALAGGVAALVTDEVDFDEPGHRVVPLATRPHRDPGLQQGSGFGV